MGPSPSHYPQGPRAGILVTRWMLTACPLVTGHHVPRPHSSCPSPLGAQPGWSQSLGCGGSGGPAQWGCPVQSSLPCPGCKNRGEGAVVIWQVQGE